MAKEAALEMFVGGLVLDPNTQAPVVILKDESGNISLPIWIGIAEATSIASSIKQLNMARPLTHDLMNDIFVQMGISVDRIIITDLKDSTYFAEIIISRGDQVLIVDARPSDAIALALRATAPIFVAEKVLELAKVALDHLPGTTSSASNEPAKEGGEGGQEEVAAEGAQDSSGDNDFRNIDKEKWEEILKKLDPDDFKYKV